MQGQTSTSTSEDTVDEEEVVDESKVLRDEYATSPALVVESGAADGDSGAADGSPGS
jgi:hypothetical protein